VRLALLITSISFTAMMVVLVIVDVSTYGVSPLDVLAVPIVGLLATALIGALRKKPRDS
jgi:peptidoglycan/LPS O-acetylase OafA/YrhL